MEASPSGLQLCGCHTCERTMHLVQCMNASSTVTTSSSSGTRPATANRSRSHPSRAMRAVPLTLSVSPFPGTRKIRPTRGCCNTLRNVSARRLPGRSGIATVRWSSTRDARRIALGGDKRRPVDECEAHVVQGIQETRPGDERNAYVVEGVHDLSE